MLFTLCNFFALRDTPETHTKTARTTSVIYSPQSVDYPKKQYTKSTHHEVFFNTITRDSHPYASPEGACRRPPRGNNWLARCGTLGAAMRLTASRQSYDSPKPTNRNLLSPSHITIPTLPIPPNQITPHINVSVHHSTCITGYGGAIGRLYDSAGSQASTCTATYTIFTNKKPLP